MHRRKLLVIPLLLPLVLSSDSSIQGSRRLLAEADRLAMLYSWPKAASLYKEAESAFAKAGDDRNALIARLGYFWSTADSGINEAVVQEVATYIENPLVQAEPALMLRVLVAKAVLDRNVNEMAAKETWEETLRLARILDDTRWRNALRRRSVRSCTWTEMFKPPRTC